MHLPEVPRTEVWTASNFGMNPGHTLCTVTYGMYVGLQQGWSILLQLR